MSKNYKPEFVEVSRDESDAMGENNDCTVRALSQATKIPYAEAHERLRKWGRKKGKGIHFANFIGNYRRINGVRITPSDMFNGLTLNQLHQEPTFLKGDWIVRVRRHVYFVSKGVIYDTHQYGGRKKVTKVFKVTQKSES